MYAEFLEALTVYVKHLNAAVAATDGAAELVPYVQFAPVLLGGELCGFLVDEVDGLYSYIEASSAQREWWEKRPR